MRLTNKIRKEIVASIIECVFRPKIDAWQSNAHQFIKDVVKHAYDAELCWYRDVEDQFKKCIVTKSTFGISAQLEPTDDHRHPSMELLQPFIECRISTVKGQKPNNNNYICQFGHPSNHRSHCSDITKIQVDLTVPTYTQFLIFNYSGKKKKLTGNVKTFFDIKQSKRDLENEICDAGEKWFSALLSISTIEKMIEKMPKLEKYIPAEFLEPKVNTNLVPVELYNDINNILP